MAKRPEERYASCGDFTDTLREALGLPRYRPAATPAHPRTEISAPPAHPATITNTPADHAGAHTTAEASFPAAAETSGTPGRTPTTRLAKLAAGGAASSAAAGGRPTPPAPQEKTVTVLRPGEARPTPTPTVPVAPTEQPRAAGRLTPLEVTGATPSAAPDRLPWPTRWDQPQAAGDQGTAAEVASVTAQEVKDPVRRLAFSPDGRLLAGLTSHQIYLWDVAANPLGEVPISGPPLFAEAVGDYLDRDLRFSPDGRFLTCGQFARHRGDGPSGIWDLSDRRVVDLELSPAMRRCVANALSPNGELFATISLIDIKDTNWRSPLDRCYLLLWNLKTRQLVDQPVKLRGRTLDNLFFTPDSRLLISYGDCGVMVRETAAGSRQHNIRIPKEARSLWVSASSDGRLLGIGTYADVVLLKNGRYSGDRGNTLTLWDTARHKITENLSITGLDGPVAFSPAGRMLAAMSGEEWTVLDTATGTRTPLPSLPPDRRPLLLPPLFSPDGRLIATHGDDWHISPIINLHETATGRPIADVRLSHGASLTSMLFSPDSRHFAVSSDAQFSGGSVYWSNLAKGADHAPRQLEAGPTPGMAFSPDSRMLAAATARETRIWQLSLARCVPGEAVDSGAPTGSRA